MSYEYCWLVKIMVAETSNPKRVKLTVGENEISKRNLKISQRTAGEKFPGKILSLRQVFSNLVSPLPAKKISRKIPSLSRVFLTKKKTVAETSFDWNLIFLRKTKKNTKYRNQIKMIKILTSFFQCCLFFVLFLFEHFYFS